MEALVEKLKIYLKKKNPTISQIMKDLELEEYQVYGLVEILKQEGYHIDIDPVKKRIVKTKIIKESDVYQIPNNLEHIRLLLISDTHLASKYDRVDILRYLYQEAEDTHTNYVLHAGDVTEGLSGRPQQLFELRELSYTAQRDYTIDKYPRSDIPTYMIAGNHDMWWIKQCGADIVSDIAKQRDDLHYLGSDCEDLKIGRLRIRLYHGSGGNAYARSYRTQKYLDAIPSEELPHILETGHVHNSFYMKQGKTHCFQTSCLQDLTPYARSKGLENDKSCWWVDVYMDDKGNPVKIAQELETFGKKLYKRR